MMMRTTCLVLFLSLAAATRSAAQPPIAPEIQLPMFLETLVLPGPDPGKWVATLNYRIDREFFVPVRNTDTTLAGPYRRMGEILIELTDSTGAAFGREIDRIDMAEKITPPSFLEHHWIQGTASFTIPPGTYRFFFEATDAESQRRQVNKELIARTPRRILNAPEISGVTFIERPAPGAPDSLILENFGGDYLFGKNCVLLVGLGLAGDTNATMRCRWSITAMDRNNEPGNVVIRDSLNALPIVKQHRVVMSKSAEGICGIPITDSSAAAAYAIVPVSTALLPLRNYTINLELTASGEKNLAFARTCRAVWPDMPFSLKNVDGALEALRFITSEHQLDSLRSGTFEQRRDALEAFWQTRNHTAETARNEVMTEYYRRVDYAIRNFGTLRSPDGSRSDRGKIFILYGPAGRTERSLNPAGGHMETWYYDRLKKKFVFVDETRTGAYTLVATSPL
jgi:GWxTD domain-containing protein